MFGLVSDYGSTVTDTKPSIVLIQAHSGRLGATVSLERDRPWYRFVDELGERHLFPIHHLSRVRQVWKQIRDQVGPRLGLPVTQTAADGAIQLYWDTGTKYLEVEVYADGTLHWFFKDLTSGERDGTDDERVRGVPSHLLQRLIALVS